MVVVPLCEPGSQAGLQVHASSVLRGCRCHVTSWKQASDSELGMAGNNQQTDRQTDSELQSATLRSLTVALCNAHNTFTVCVLLFRQLVY